jgi:chromosome segregation ATPase
MQIYLNRYLEIQPKKRNIEERNENEEERSSKRQHCSIVELEDDPKTLKSILQTKESEMANLKRELEQYRQCFNECGFALIDPERVKREWKELQENNAKLKNQISDLKLRESALVIRLSQREQEVIELTVSFFFHFLFSLTQAISL